MNEETFDISLLIDQAMKILKQMPSGGVGEDGATQKELNEAAENGRCFDGDANYHCAQQAFLYLAVAKDLLKEIS